MFGLRRRSAHGSGKVRTHLACDIGIDCGLFQKHNVFDFLELPALQWQSIENTVMDIDEHIEARS